MGSVYGFGHCTPPPAQGKGSVTLLSQTLTPWLSAVDASVRIKRRMSHTEPLQKVQKGAFGGPMSTRHHGSVVPRTVALEKVTKHPAPVAAV